ncbi:MAG TPA: hypothetical protein VG125_15175 [Pirellulales bacterium]|nr:hypothetical protein [Pirellulales bacterium]
MKSVRLTTLLALTTLAIPATARAQYSSTAAEGYLHGSADVARGMGQFYLYSSQAAVNGQEAYSRLIDNQRQQAAAYWDVRHMNRSLRAEERQARTAGKDITRWNASRLPRRLTPAQFDARTGNIHWPGTLAGPEFAPARAKLVRLFRNRATDDSRIASEDGKNVKSLVATMQAQLKGKISDLPPGEFISAKKFLDSLAYEAQLAPDTRFARAD